MSELEYHYRYGEPQTATAQAQAAISEIPSSCMCTWSWGPRFWWERIVPKDTCPWHRTGDRVAAEARRT